MRTQRLEDLVRHWRNLLVTANEDGVPADHLREELAALDRAMASGNVTEIRRALDEARSAGLALEGRLRAEQNGAT